MARSRRRDLPSDPVIARIDYSDSDGFGTTQVDERTVRVHGALAGELVSFRYTQMRRDRAEGQVVDVLEVSPDRNPVQCPQF